MTNKELEKILKNKKLFQQVIEMLCREDDCEDAFIDEEYRGKDGLSPDIPEEKKKLDRIDNRIDVLRNETVGKLKQVLGILVKKYTIIDDELLYQWERSDYTFDIDHRIQAKTAYPRLWASLLERLQARSKAMNDGTP